ncbi:unnamed protein product [Polarella glacialis]|uniref:CULT domain-containing protein n=1 Tax=Polarella glacialis TaxID=89957 RepID=A0A813J5Z3_POLGL|nr:unnamed protein product [Polarella glacialis]
MPISPVSLVSIADVWPPMPPMEAQLQAAPIAAALPCLACALCGQAVAIAKAVICDGALQTLREAVYAYELTVLGCRSVCFSVTAPSGDRFDLVCVDEVLRVPGSVPGSLTSGGRGAAVFGSGRSSGSRKASPRGALRVAGVHTFDKEPSAEHSWFPGYTWQAVRCGGCDSRELLGWAFAKEGVDSPSPPAERACPQSTPRAACRQSSGFFALIVTRLRERSMSLLPARGPFGLPLVSAPFAAARDQESELELTSRHTMVQRGLRADELRRSSGPAASAAARGLGSMPRQFLPSTTNGVSSGVSGNRAALLGGSTCHPEGGLRSLSPVDSRASSSGEGSEDFAHQHWLACRSHARLAAEARGGGRGGGKGGSRGGGMDASMRAGRGVGSDGGAGGTTRRWPRSPGSSPRVTVGHTGLGANIAERRDERQLHGQRDRQSVLGLPGRRRGQCHRSIVAPAELPPLSRRAAR